MTSIKTPNGSSVSEAEAVILGAVAKGINRWSKLATHYFGVARLKVLPGRTAVQQKLANCQKKGFLSKDNGTYLLTDAGTDAIKALEEANIDPSALISKARTDFELANPMKVEEYKADQEKFDIETTGKSPVIASTVDEEVPA